LDVVKRERSGIRARRGAHTTIVTGEIAVEVGVEPQPRADNRRVLVRLRALTDEEPAAVALGGHLDDGVPGEASPAVKVGPETSRTVQPEEVAIGQAPERLEEVVQETG
jgi:hypothetical protein